MNQIVAGLTMVNRELWDWVTQFFSSQAVKSGATDTTALSAPAPNLIIQAQKMTKDDDSEAFINTFEQNAIVADWPATSWVAILIPCLIGPSQQAVDILPLQDFRDYKKVRAAVLQTLNLNPKAYCRWLRETEFGPDHPRGYEPRA